jgi:chaperone BCS1
LKLNNGQSGYDKDAVTSIGYGTHWIIYKGVPIIIRVVREEANQTSRDKETITIIKFGRSKKLIEDFVKSVGTFDDSANKTKVYAMYESWNYVKDQPKRSLDSVFIEKEKRDILVSALDKFTSGEEWYLKNGIPYQLGILLYGSPGTGKTSLVKAISAYLEYPIYYLPADKMENLGEAVRQLPDKCVMVIEDIDASISTRSRKKKTIGDKNDAQDAKKNLFDELSGYGLSEILNAMDGMFSAHGRILIATTNHIEKLDAALIRPGRIDLKLEIGFATKEVVRDFMVRFFGKCEFPKNVELRKNITVAELQGMVLEGKTHDEIMKNIECVDTKI